MATCAHGNDITLFDEIDEATQKATGWKVPIAQTDDGEVCPICPKGVAGARFLPGEPASAKPEAREPEPSGKKLLREGLAEIARVNRARRLQGCLPQLAQDVLAAALDMAAEDHPDAEERAARAIGELLHATFGVAERLGFDPLELEAAVAMERQLEVERAS